MEIKYIQWGSWERVYRNTLVTVGRSPRRGVTDSFKEKMIKSRHSPLRCIGFDIQLIGIPYFVSVHLVRHKIGVEHFVKTQRTDRTGVDRKKSPQDALVNHTIAANYEAILNISQKRLCRLADEDTREVWEAVVDALPEPALRAACRPACEVLRECPEAFGPCGK